MAFGSVRAAWFLLDRREGTTEIGSRIALGPAGSDGVPEHPPAVPMRPVRCLDGAPGLESAAGLVAWSRASLSPTAGYTTNEIRFSLAAKQYLTRYHVPPAGATSRYRPLSSKSLTCFSLGLALRIAVSVCGGASVSRMGGQCFPKCAPHLPPDVVKGNPPATPPDQRIDHAHPRVPRRAHKGNAHCPAAARGPPWEEEFDTREGARLQTPALGYPRPAGEKNLPVKSETRSERGQYPLRSLQDPQ